MTRDTPTPSAASATVIPFPRRPGLTAAANDENGRERLARALASLDAALGEQKATVAQWRRSLAELQQSVHGLADGFTAYRENVDRASTGVSRLREQALLLAARADAMQDMASQDTATR
jgi:hypothetical protein